MRTHLQPSKVCERCGVTEGVHKGFCRRCREVLLGPGVIVGPGHEETPHQADAEPLHSPPWRRRGA